MNSIKKGFTLIEVCLTLLVFAIAMTALMGLFPVGLRQASLATGDMAESLFADYLLSSVQAAAAEVAPDDWRSVEKFSTSLNAKFNELGIVQPDGKSIHLDKSGKATGEMGDDDESRKEGRAYIKYELQIDNVVFPYDFNHRLYKVVAKVSSNKHLDLNDGLIYLTDVFCMGDVPQ